MTNWRKYSKMVVKNIWLVMLITLVFVSVAAYISLFKITPQYEAGTQLMIRNSGQEENNRITYEELLAGPLLARNYKELIMSGAVTSQVIQNLQLSEMTDKDLADSMVVELIPDSSMIHILVRNESKEAVVNITNEVSTVFIQKASQLLKTENIMVIDRARASERPVYPRPILIIGFSFLAGLMLSLGLILVLTYFDDSLGDWVEIEKKTGFLVVGTIPDTKSR